MNCPDCLIETAETVELDETWTCPCCRRRYQRPFDIVEFEPTREYAETPEGDRMRNTDHVDHWEAQLKDALSAGACDDQIRLLEFRLSSAREET